MKAGDWASILSAVIALIALAHSLWVRRQSGQAALRAANAELRADEALALATEMVEHDRARVASEQAQLEAPAVADSWIGQIKAKWGERSGADHFVLNMPVVTPAQRHALEIVRSKKESLYIIQMQHVQAEQMCRISAWNRAGYNRRFGKIPPPPGSAS